MKPTTFVEIVVQKVKEEIRDLIPRVRFATIDPNYSGGLPSVIFDGESTTTIKTYTYLSSYTPSAGERVMILNNTILGKLEN